VSTLKIIFMGTAELACASLQALLRDPSFAVTAVVTQPDRPKGRDLKLQPSPVKQVALRAGTEVLQPERARHPALIEELRARQPELIVVAAYGQILPPAILELPRFGCLNVHTSLLPRHRGAAPIQWAILEGDAETGVTIMKMDAGLDTGEMLTKVATPITEADNAQTLHDRLAELGAGLLARTIPEYIAGRVTPQAQISEGATYARKITKEDGRLDWSRPARSLWNRLRAFTPWPGAFTFLPAEPRPRLLKIWAAEIVAHAAPQTGWVISADKSGVLVGCGENALRVTALQLEGGRRLGAAEFLAGHPLRIGTVLG